MKIASALSLLVLLPACGGSGTTTTPPSPSPTTVPCTQTSVFGPAQGSLPARSLDIESFSTSTTGRVDVVLDWTFADSPMGLYVVQGSCGLDQFNARTCNFLARSEPPGPKPRRISAPNVTPGNYSLLIGNFADVDESVSTQVFVSSSSCPPLAVAPPSGAALDQARTQRSGILRR